MALVLTVLAGGAAGLMLAPAKAPAPAEPPAPRPIRAPATIATLARDPSGHFLAQATVNGHAVRMLVDTGASIVALTPDDARAAGLSVDPARWTEVGRTASGRARGERLMLASVGIGGVRRMDVDAVVVEGLPVSLLGQSFLRKLAAVEIKGDQMTLR